MKYKLKEALLEDFRQYAKQTKRCSVRNKNIKQNISIVFYADDFVVIHENKEIILKVKEYIERWLEKIGLKLRPTTRKSLQLKWKFCN
ncbi:MAG: hypothetical protein IJ730_00360 [Alphaproteobacteria bacterium]|nr:hypothetical protein [Alphaproteobacteria bacterium]